ncbi:MAG: mechanosensitive ion channel family protein [Oscillospiraceae bacterium]|nr:mechanosensitive ion channel family protein [Oscillospiraceae bacterium]
MKKLLKILIYLGLFAAFFLIDRFALPHPVFRVLAMAFGVLLCVALLRLILGLFEPKERKGKTALSIIGSLLRYASVLVILCWGLSLLGVELNTIVTSVGILALIIGFGAESLVADVVTGVFLLIDSQYNVDDIVEVDGFRGTVKEIGVRTTSIVDPGGNIKIINNSEMRNILNRSDRLSRSVSDIAIPYGTDLEELEKNIPALMQEIFAARGDMMQAPPVYLGVQELAESSVVLRFVVEVAEKDIYAGARALNHDLLLGFRRLGVECPFPQLDVHQH